MKLRVRRPTSQKQCFQGAKTTFRLHERQKASCEGPKCIIFHHNNEALEKTMKNTPFQPLATDAKARRTRKYAYLCTVSEGDRSPPVPAAVKKKPPSATHGSLVVIEHRRTHETIVRCSLFALISLNPSRTKAQRGPLFRPNACQNAVRVITSHRPPNDISQKQ